MSSDNNDSNLGDENDENNQKRPIIKKWDNLFQTMRAL